MACPSPARGAILYEVPESPGEAIGTWDVNIMADDVHFETASIIRRIRLRLAVAGFQECTLWVFDGLDRPPLYTTTFANVPATGQYHMSTYDFDLHLQVPKDVYVGFSARIGGWNLNGSDSWSRGFTVQRGVAGTPGEYYYGSVAGGALTSVFAPGDGSHGCLQIHSEPVRFDEMEVVTGQVRLAVAELPVYGTNALEQADSPAGTNWMEVETLPPGASNHVWTATNGLATSAFFRVRTR